MKMTGTRAGTTITGNPHSHVLSGSGNTLAERILFYTGMIHRPEQIKESATGMPDPDETQEYRSPLNVPNWISLGKPEGVMNSLNTGSSHGLLFVPPKRG